jgi:hypothetical protein
MLARYQIRRGAKAAELPDGERQDTRKHTRHALRPADSDVDAFLAGALGPEAFAAAYRRTLAARLADDAGPFDALAARARTADVFLGCSCPTRRVPDVRHCHTWHALAFMADRYPDLVVRYPDPPGTRGR